MLILMMMLTAGPQQLPPYFVKIVQNRTLYAADEPVFVTLRLSNQREAILRARKWPDLIDALEVSLDGKRLEAKGSSKDLFKRSDSLGINAHRDFRIDLRRFYTGIEPGKTFEIRYEDEYTESRGKLVRVVNLPLPDLDTPFRIQTSKGDITVTLAPTHAPNHCRNFALLVSMQFYRNMIWHRVVPGRLIQTGDPLGTGEGGSGFDMTLEISPFLEHDRYVLGMARAPALDSASSQIYITTREIEQLDGKYTVFGRVTKGFEVVDAINAVPTSGPNGTPPEKPLEDVALISIEPVDEP